jgi:hypothetical protein
VRDEFAGNGRHVVIYKLASRFNITPQNQRRHLEDTQKDSASPQDLLYQFERAESSGSIHRSPRHALVTGAWFKD